MNKLLCGHTSAETAFVQDNYPWGSRIKTKRRVWIEYRKGYGYRFCYQTLDPKKMDKLQDEARSWCAVKHEGYAPVMVLTLNTDNNHVETFSLSGYASVEEIEKFEQDWHEALEKEPGLKAVIQYMKARRRAEKRLEYTVTSGQETDQSLKEQAEFVHKLTLAELKKEK